MNTAIHFAAWPRLIWHWIKNSFEADRSRAFLWCPVVMGAGAASYLSMKTEPSLATGLGAMAAGVTIALVARRSTLAGLRMITVAFALAATGFCAGSVRTRIVAAPMLAAQTGTVVIAGRVIGTELADKGTRILMDRLSIATLPIERTPERIRLRLTKYSAVPQAGARIVIKANVMPPPGPAEPGAHDFRRDSYFAGVGGVGYALGYPTIVQSGTLDGGQAWLEKLRQHIGNRLIAVLGKSPETAIATAYLTGERGLIDEQSAADMRASGLAHLLAISGMKVGLVALLVFGVVQVCLNLLPRIGLRWPTRKIAAGFGIAAAIAYTCLAASPVPALRSVLMTGMGMFAIIFDRQGFSLRLAAIAAMIVILWQPESVASVSFQMSFGAVVALIAFYEAFRDAISTRYRHAGRLRRSMLNVGKIILTTFVATLVTAPLALIHFQQEANYSIVANAVAIPLNDIWIMPSALVGMGLMPFGLDALPFKAMAAGIHLMLAIAMEVSQWPGAVTHMPYIGDAPLVLLVAGGLWIIIWRSAWRRLGVIPVLTGCMLAFFQHPPDIIVSEDGIRAAFRLGDGMLAVSKQTKSDFTDDSWDKLNGSRGMIAMPEDGVLDNGNLNCTGESCTWSTHSQLVAVIRDPAKAGDICNGKTIVIMPKLAQVNCAAQLEIDPSTLAATGAIAIRLGHPGYAISSVADQEGQRPWSINNSAASLSIAPGP